MRGREDVALYNPDPEGVVIQEYECARDAHAAYRRAEHERLTRLDYPRDNTDIRAGIHYHHERYSPTITSYNMDRITRTNDDDPLMECLPRPRWYVVIRGVRPGIYQS